MMQMMIPMLYQVTERTLGVKERHNNAQRKKFKNKKEYFNSVVIIINYYNDYHLKNLLGSLIRHRHVHRERK